MRWPKRVRTVRILRMSERERGFLQFLQGTTVWCTRVPPPFCGTVPDCARPPLSWIVRGCMRCSLSSSSCRLPCVSLAFGMWKRWGFLVLPHYRMFHNSHISSTWLLSRDLFIKQEILAHFCCNVNRGRDPYEISSCEQMCWFWSVWFKRPRSLKRSEILSHQDLRELSPRWRTGKVVSWRCRSRVSCVTPSASSGTKFCFCKNN